MGRGRKFTADRKWCNGCRHWHLLVDFSKDKATASGKQDYCKACNDGRGRRRDRGHPPVVDAPVFPVAPKVYAQGSGFIYVIGNEELGRYKIGIAKNVQKRLGVLKVSSPVSLVLVAKKEFQNVYEVERQIHQNLAQFNLHGEWFQLTREQAESVLNDNRGDCEGT
jgi:T5orf172 domain